MRSPRPLAIILALSALTTGSALAQVLSPEDQARLYFSERLFTAANGRCDSVDPASSQELSDTLSALRSRFHVPLEVGKQRIRAKDNGATLSRLEELARAGGDQLILGSTGGPTANCRELTRVVREFSELGVGGLAKKNFQDELLLIEHKQGMRCSKVAENLRKSVQQLSRDGPLSAWSGVGVLEVDIFVQTDLKRVHTAALGCIIAQAAARQREIDFTGDFVSIQNFTDLLLRLSNPIWQAEHSNREELMQSARDTAARVLREGSPGE